MKDGKKIIGDDQRVRTASLPRHRSFQLHCRGAKAWREGQGHGDLAQEAGFKVEMAAGKTERVGVNPSHHSRSWRLLSLVLARQCGPATPTLKRLRQEHHEFQVIPQLHNKSEATDRRGLGDESARGPSEDPGTHGKSCKWSKQPQAC